MACKFIKLFCELFLIFALSWIEKTHGLCYVVKEHEKDCERK